MIDIQKDFINGSLGIKEAETIVDSVKVKIDAYRTNGDEIIFICDTHQQNYLETNKGKHLPVVHCIERSGGWQIGVWLGTIIINKLSFGYTDWAGCDFSEVELIGLCADICVVSNALIIKALCPKIKVSVDARCCAGVTPESHNAVLLTIKMCQVERCQ